MFPEYLLLITPAHHSYSIHLRSFFMVLPNENSMLINRSYMWEHKKYPKRTCRERFTPSRFKSPPLRWLVDVVSLPWAQASGWWLCCSHAETFLFTAVLADGGTPGAAARSIRPAELWTWTGNTQSWPEAQFESAVSTLTVSTRSPFLWAGPPAAQWDSAVRRPLWTWAASLLLYKRWAWSLVTQM